MKRTALLLVLALATAAHGAATFGHSYASAGNLYGVVLDASGQAWNGSAFEAYNAANWTTYDVPMTNTANNWHGATFPATIAAGTYTVQIYLRAGATAATSDTLLGTGALAYDGTNEIDLTRLNALLAALDAVVDTIAAAVGGWIAQ